MAQVKTQEAVTEVPLRMKTQSYYILIQDIFWAKKLKSASGYPTLPILFKKKRNTMPRETEISTWACHSVLTFSLRYTRTSIIRWGSLQDSSTSETMFSPLPRQFRLSDGKSLNIWITSSTDLTYKLTKIDTLLENTKGGKEMWLPWSVCWVCKHSFNQLDRVPGHPPRPAYS